MSKVSKVVSGRLINSLSPKPNKMIKSNLSKFNSFNISALSKSLLCLGMLGSVIVQSCEPSDFRGEFPVIDDSILLSEKLDKVLESLEIFIEPNSSIKDIETFSFDSDKGEQFFFKIEDIKDSSIIMNQIKFYPDLKREDSVLTILPSDKGFELIKTIESDVKNMKFEQDGKILKSFILKNGDWVEESILQGHEFYIMREFTDGSFVRYFNMKSNIEFPEEIFFESPEEHEDEVVFG